MTFKGIFMALLGKFYCFFPAMMRTTSPVTWSYSHDPVLCHVTLVMKLADHDFKPLKPQAKIKVFL